MGYVNIAQAPHHWACPIEPMMESHGILILTSSICCWLDLSSYDGSSVGHQWDYIIEQLSDQYWFLDICDHFQLATPPHNKFSEEEFTTIRCKAETETSPSFFTPVLVEMNHSSEGIHSKPFYFYSASFGT